MRNITRKFLPKAPKIVLLFCVDSFYVSLFLVCFPTIVARRVYNLKNENLKWYRFSWAGSHKFRSRKNLICYDQAKHLIFYKMSILETFDLLLGFIVTNLLDIRQEPTQEVWLDVKIFRGRRNLSLRVCLGKSFDGMIPI